MAISFAQHLAAFALVGLDVLVRGVRIRVLLPMSLFRAITVNTCGDALAAVTPARLGGEPLRFVAFQRSGASPAAVIAALATEVCVDAILIVAIGLIVALAFRNAGRAWLERLAELTASPSARWVTVAVLASLVLGGGVVVRLRRRWHVPLVHGTRDAWRLLTTRSPGALARVAGLTLVSMVARSAILPVLAASVPEARLAGLMAGSFVLLFAQSVLPVPAGLGSVDLGFAAWFAGTLRDGDLARLLVLWRFYTIALGALAGALLLMRAPRSLSQSAP
jgi:hypothetical protein